MKSYNSYKMSLKRELTIKRNVIKKCNKGKCN